MALNSLVIPPGLDSKYYPPSAPIMGGGGSFSQTLLPTLPPGMEDGGGPQLFPNQINQLPDHNYRSTPGPISGDGMGIHTILPRRPGPIFRPLPSPPVNNMPGPIFSLRPRFQKCQTTLVSLKSLVNS